MADDGLWGLLGRMRAQPGKRDELIAVLQESSRGVEGKLLYLIQLEQDDSDAFWINEVWRTKGHYDACLDLPQVKRGIERAAPLIAGGEHRTETRPLGSIDDY